MAKKVSSTKVNKKSLDNKKSQLSKDEVPVLKTPGESRTGRIITWVVVISMTLASLFSVVAIIYHIVTSSGL